MGTKNRSVLVGWNVIHSFLLPAADLVLESMNQQEKLLELTLDSSTKVAVSPHCQQSQSHVHSRYVRKIAYLPWADCRVKLLIRIRRFFCHTSSCRRKTFAERPAFLLHYARRTTRLAINLGKLALTTSAQCGSRLSSMLSMPVRSSTMLRLMHGYRMETLQPPTLLGVDDSDMWKGKSYGTILVDMEKQQVVELLADRESATLADWLSQRPGISLITRDRAPAYAEAATVGAPQAIQVADRFHLLVNITDALQTFFDRQAERTTCFPQGGGRCRAQSALLVVLLIIAIGIRVKQYGITENRYFIVALSLWLAFIATFFLFRKRQNIKVIPVSSLF